MPPGSLEQVVFRMDALARLEGAGVVVMAFDERGQADTTERKLEILERAYRLLTERAGYDSRDIVFDPNVLAVATGIAEHTVDDTHSCSATPGRSGGLICPAL